MAYTVHAHTALGSFELTITAASVQHAEAKAKKMFCGPTTRFFVALRRD